MAELRPSRVQVNIEDLSTKQRNAVLSIIKDIDFTAVEISELVVKIGFEDESGGTEEETD